jgi:hypothetical protein
MYSGAGAGHVWTQTEAEIELRAPIESGVVSSSAVRTTPNSLEIGFPPTSHLAGKLSGTVTADEPVRVVH